MKKLASSMLSALFVIGVLVYPATHRAMCLTEACGAGGGDVHGWPCLPSEDGVADRCASPNNPHTHTSTPAKHDAEHCPVCQLACAPMAPSMPVDLPSTLGVPTERAFLPVDTPRLGLEHLLPFSCGPPA